MNQRLKKLAKTLRQELSTYRLALKDPRTPRLAKVCFWLAFGYLVLPFDLIPDFIPGIGHIDDLIIIPGLIYLALKLTPGSVIADCRAQARQTTDPG